MALNAAALHLYLVTDPILTPGDTVLNTVRAAVQGGVTCVQLRDKTASTRARTQLALALKDVLLGTGVPLVINDDVDAAVASNADGVHLGQDDMSVVDARARLAPGKIVGLSCETVAQVRAANSMQVDYLGLGTVFATATKPDHKAAVGLTGLAAMARAALLPNVAIGGLKAAHAAGVLEAGCDGMAVVSAICGQPDPEEAARQIHKAIATSNGGPGR